MIVHLLSHESTLFLLKIIASKKITLNCYTTKYKCRSIKFYNKTLFIMLIPCCAAALSFGGIDYLNIRQQDLWADEPRHRQELFIGNEFL